MLDCAGAAGRGLAAAALALAALGGCALVLREETAEQRGRAREAGRPFAERHEARALPELPEQAPLEAVLSYAFLSNADVERAYFDWVGAVERIPQATSLPDPRFSYEYLFTDERLRRWNRTTLGISQMIPLPAKLSRAGEVALADSRAAQLRLEDAKFSLQAAVVAAWHELWLVDRNIEIDEDNLALLRELAEVTRQRVAVGRALQADASKADLEVASAENQLLTRRAQRSAALGEVNALLSRPVDAPLCPAAPLPGAPLPRSDAELLALAAERNPELGALAAEARGRESAVELARLAYVPDLELGLDVRGSMERMLGAMLNLPVQFARVRAGIDEAGASQRSAQAAVRARRNDVGAQMALQLFLARDSERQIGWLRETLLPRARDVLSAIEVSYATGGASFLELLDAQRTLLELERALAEQQVTRASAAAALEALCALDFGTLS
jgi:outer membrane protein TolC